MIRIQQLKMPPGHTQKALEERILKALHIGRDQLGGYEIRKQSIDARKKPDIQYVYVVDVWLKGISESKCAARAKNNNISICEPKKYRFPETGSRKMMHRPVIIGTGPAGLFCGYMLAAYGYRPVLLERGKDVERRTADVKHFWKTGELDTESNVSFGEGGAGTFSDGKLNTLIKDKDGRGQHVLKIFVENGAQPEILYEAKPHIGTDVLSGVVKNMRKRIESWGGEVFFESRADGFVLENGAVKAVRLADGSRIETDLVVLACGHSARDTFAWLHGLGVSMEPKAFALGLRVEHPQELINQSQYGIGYPSCLPAAPYKLTAQTSNGRGVYSFCMCPGGYVVNASSEEKRLVVNGMSYSARDSQNANSAIIVSVTPEDFGADRLEKMGPLAGVEFQRELEEKAFAVGIGEIPVQKYGDFASHATAGKIPADFVPCIRGKWHFADVASILPKELKASFEEGMEKFGHVILGFDDENALLSGIESRTSSPVRICRDEEFQSNIRGLYPCGEGAGYAGGITSAAMDGMRIAEVIASGYAPMTEEK